MGTTALPAELEGIFGNQSDVFKSRQDIFDEAAKTIPNLEKVVYLTILWGYSNGMRNDYFSCIVDQMLKLTRILGQARERGISDWKSHFSSTDNRLRGLGPSTRSKLLYFLGVKVESYEALILDQRLVDVFKNKVFDDFSDLEHLKPEKDYVCYLRKMDAVAQSLAVPKENIEMFLFTFGSQLKANERCLGSRP